MSNVLGIDNLLETTLFKRLEALKSDPIQGPCASKFIGVLPEICAESAARMKRLPELHPQFTLHDETHLLRVSQLMALVIGYDTLSCLSAIEITLLILSAYLHDQGMVPDSTELEAITHSEHFQVYCEIWKNEHPNLKELEDQLNDPELSSEFKSAISSQIDELIQEMHAEYIRRNHGKRSFEYIRRTFSNDKRIALDGIFLTDMLASLCESHVLPARDLIGSTSLPMDSFVAGMKVNLLFLAVVLRLADILDFDRERTPDALFTSIHFTSKVSQREWEKHRGVQGWEITKDRIRFHAKFSEPIYEKATRQFMDMIDTELEHSSHILRNFPNTNGIANDYQLGIPYYVDRTAIGPKHNSYIYHDLEFTLSRNEIVKLLMTDNLYGSESLCIRELVQNSLDALRYRKALLSLEGSDWNAGQISLEHGLDEKGYEYVQCIDNGAGMDEEIISKFLTKVGRSYYRSPEFDQELQRFRSQGLGFDPCSKFGIGFMSCFMLSDYITIRTRRDYGGGRGHGRGLEVKIHGLASIVTIRELPDLPVGTTVKLHLQKKPPVIDMWDDKVRLVDVIEGFALAVEFPISATCSIEEIKEFYAVEPSIAVHHSWIDTKPSNQIKILTQSFKELCPDLDGFMQEGFLVDKEGKFAIKTDSSFWVPPKTDSDAPTLSVCGHSITRNIFMPQGQVCADGILIGGTPGRGGRIGRIGWRNSPIISSSSYLLDVRGEMKPELTPARTPPDRFFGFTPPGWKRLGRYVHLAEGKIWDNVLVGIDSEKPSLFWELATIYRFWPLYLSSQSAWTHLKIPCAAKGRTEWREISQLGILEVEAYHENKEDRYRLLDSKNRKLVLPKSMEKWKLGRFKEVQYGLTQLVLALCSVSIRSGKVAFTPTTPHAAEMMEDSSIRPEQGARLRALKYTETAVHFFSVTKLVSTLNIEHPLVKTALKAQIESASDNFVVFCRSACFCLSDPVTHAALENGKVTHAMKHLGMKYLRIAWDKYIDNMKPPYKVAYQTNETLKTLEITDTLLREWAAHTATR